MIVNTFSESVLTQIVHVWRKSQMDHANHRNAIVQTRATMYAVRMVKPMEIRVVWNVLKKSIQIWAKRAMASAHSVNVLHIWHPFIDLTEEVYIENYFLIFGIKMSLFLTTKLKSFSVYSMVSKFEQIQTCQTFYSAIKFN